VLSWSELNPEQQHMLITTTDASIPTGGREEAHDEAQELRELPLGASRTPWTCYRLHNRDQFRMLVQQHKQQR
jgi:hypothetical protein